MSDRDRIQLKVRRLRRVRRLQLGADYLVRGVAWGAIPAALTILAGKLWILPVGGLILAGAGMALVVLGFGTAALLRRLSPLAVAGDIDQALGLRTRVSSALALTAPLPGDKPALVDPFVKALVGDAARAVQSARPKQVYPWGPPRAWQYALIGLAVVTGLTFLPQFNLFANEQDRATAKLVQETGKRLAELAKQYEKEAEKRQDPELKKMAEEVKRAGEKLQGQNVDKKEALKQLQKLEDKLNEQAQARVNSDQRALLDKLAQDLKQGQTTKELGDLLQNGKMPEFTQQLQQLMDDLAAGKLTPEQMKTLEEMAQALEQALKTDAAGKPGAEDLKQTLEDLKKALANAKAMQEQLQKTFEQFSQAVEKLNEQLKQDGMSQQAQQLQQLLQQMQQQMAQNGMPNQQTLEQMKQALNQASQAVSQNPSLSQQQQQQLQQMIEDAQQYIGDKGQLSQAMQQATQQRQQAAQKMNEACSKSGG